jgi:hypothetical protein
VELAAGGSVISVFVPEASATALDPVAVVAQNMLAGRLGEAVRQMASAASRDQ